VLQPNQKPFPNVLPLVSLHGATTPFTFQTLADGAGKFKFKNLQQGMYTLTVAIPNAGQTQQTIEVGPSLADAKRVVRKTIVFDPGSDRESNVVSARQLSVPENARRLYQKAEERLGKRDTPGAIKLLEKSVELAPQFSVAWNHLGTIAYQSQRYDQAEQYFREALKQDPDSYAPLVNLGGALLAKGKVEESLQVNLRAVKAWLDYSLAHSQLGQSYLLAKQVDDAETHLKQAKALDPMHFSLPQLLLTRIHQARADYPAMVRELEEFLRLHPDSDLAPRMRELLEKVRPWAR